MIVAHHTASSEPCLSVSRYTALQTARQPSDRDNLYCSSQRIPLQVLSSYQVIEPYVVDHDNHRVIAVS